MASGRTLITPQVRVHMWKPGWPVSRVQRSGRGQPGDPSGTGPIDTALSRLPLPAATSPEMAYNTSPPDGSFLSSLSVPRSWLHSRTQGGACTLPWFSHGVQEARE